MTSFTTDTTRTDRLGSLRRMRDAVLRGLESYMERQSRMDTIRRYQAMSDDELASRGLRRQDIPLHVYRDYGIF